MALLTQDRWIQKLHPFHCLLTFSRSEFIRKVLHISYTEYWNIWDCRNSCMTVKSKVNAEVSHLTDEWRPRRDRFVHCYKVCILQGILRCNVRRKAWEKLICEKYEIKRGCTTQTIVYMIFNGKWCTVWSSTSQESEQKVNLSKRDESVEVFSFHL